MDLGIYKLHKDYSDLFLSTTKNSEESIFLLPRSIEYKVTLGNWTVMNEVSRNPGGWGAFAPSWDLLAAYTCTDGLPIDESPLFDPHNPFKNRDPRCTATIVEFGTRHLGFEYNPHPDAVQVMNYNTGKMQKTMMPVSMPNLLLLMDCYGKKGLMKHGWKMARMWIRIKLLSVMQMSS